MGIIRMWKNRKLVLGMNERNLGYISRYNTRTAKAIVDNKLNTKKKLIKANIPTPKLLGVIKNYVDLENFNWDSLPKSFVIKPVSGIEGGGIEIFYNRDKEGRWIKADGTRWSTEMLTQLANEIISGKYSLHNEPDQVFFEERVKMHKDFQYYAYKGAPDVRVLINNSIPIMSYVRLPTPESNGKANLALGAVGVGIDISTGVTTTAVQGKSKIIDKIPNTQLTVSGIKIPYWNRILRYAIEAQLATGLKFGAVDFLIDREAGPMIVELNARPGLSIQIANQDGLRWRLRKSRGIKLQSIEKAIRVGKDLFGGDIEEDIERISGKYLIGIYENVILYPKLMSAGNIISDSEKTTKEHNNQKGDTGNKKKKKIQAKEILIRSKIDTGADNTSIDEKLARQLGYGPEIDKFYELVADMGLPEKIATLSEALEVRDKLNLKIKELNLPDLIQSISIRSSHGRSIRALISITLKLGEYKFTTKATVYDRSQLEYKMIVGRKALDRFLVEPSRTKPSMPPIFTN